MLLVYVPHGTTLERIAVEPGSSPPDNAVWIDMVTPTVQEDKLVEQLLGIAVPTREEMQEIEVSSRLYVENGARYMTATLDVPVGHAGAEDHCGHLHSFQAIVSRLCATTTRGPSPLSSTSSRVPARRKCRGRAC